MSESDYADLPASDEKHSPAHEETSLPNPAVASGENSNNDAPCNGVAPTHQADGCFSDDPVTRCTDDPISEVGSCPLGKPNNDAPCNGVAPTQEADGCSSDDPLTRCTDAPMLCFDLPDALINFLGDYLICTEQQRLVLALWIIHTHCLSASDFSPYLDIRSSQKHSGKSLCLQLLSLLCHKPALTTGFSTAVITDRLHGHNLTVLLDDRETTLGSLNRSKNPTLRTVLAGGFQRGIGYSDRFHERTIYSPKAFAGMSKLPEMLADCSIPIDLEPKKPGDSGYRFRRSQVQAMAAPLLEWLQQLSPWAVERLKDAPAYSPEEFPEGLSFRQQDCVESLLQIADLFGGPWPAKAREALVTLFRERVKLDQQEGLQLLAAIHDILSQGSFPERISTSDLLPSLQNLKGRPWNLEGPITAQKLAYLLQAFGVAPRLQRISPTRTARGYRFEDFQAAWKQFLNIEIVNNHAGCNGVAPSGKQPIAEAVRPSNGAVSGAAGSSHEKSAQAVLTDNDADYELLQYIQQQHGPSFDREWLADTRARGYEPLHPGDPSSPHTYHGSVPVRTVNR